MRLVSSSGSALTKFDDAFVHLQATTRLDVDTPTSSTTHGTAIVECTQQTWDAWGLRIKENVAT